MESIGIGNRSVKTLVLEDIAVAHVFERHGIDYCCGGDESLDSACTRKGLQLQELLEEIETTKSARPYSFLHSDLWDVEFLIEYLIENHHRYCKATIPVLITQLRKVVETHGEKLPHYRPVLMLFERVAQMIEQHMRKEEMILFPYIMSLASAAEFDSRKPEAPFLSIGWPILKMEEEHIEVGHIFLKLRGILNDFHIPVDARNLQRASINGLQAFTKDMHQHIHLEDNVLFPKAKELEARFDTRTGTHTRKLLHRS